MGKGKEWEEVKERIQRVLEKRWGGVNKIKLNPVKSENCLFIRYAMGRGVQMELEVVAR